MIEYIIVIIVLIIILILSSKFLKRFTSGLIDDYLFDGIFSFADNFAAGAGLAGIDVGDWIGAVIIFVRERKIIGNFPALIVAWEATNFLPLSFIPVVGEVIELFTNVFPAATVMRVSFSKFKKAEESKEKLERDLSMAERLGFKFKKDKFMDKVNKLVDSDPVKVIMLTTKKDKEISSKLIDYYNDVIKDIQKLYDSYLIQTTQLNPPKELLDGFHDNVDKAQGTLKESENLMLSKEYDKAIELALSIQGIINNAAKEFNRKLNEYNERFKVYK